MELAAIAFTKDGRKVKLRREGDDLAVFLDGDPLAESQGQWFTRWRADPKASAIRAIESCCHRNGVEIAEINFIAI